MRDIANSTGISIGHLGNIENEYVLPSLEVCQKIANFYNITLSQLLLNVNVDMSDLLHVGERREQSWKRYRGTADSLKAGGGGKKEHDG